MPGGLFEPEQFEQRTDILMELLGLVLALIQARNDAAAAEAGDRRRRLLEDNNGDIF